MFRNLELIGAVNRNNVDDVRQAIQENGIISYARGGITAFHISAQKGNPAIMEILIDAARDSNNISLIDGPRHGGITPLIDAIQNEHPEIIRLLMRAGADENREGVLGRTPMSIAAEEHPKMLSVLQDELRLRKNISLVQRRQNVALGLGTTFPANITSTIGNYTVGNVPRRLTNQDPIHIVNKVKARRSNNITSNSNNNNNNNQMPGLEPITPKKSSMENVDGGKRRRKFHKTKKSKKSRSRKHK